MRESRWEPRWDERSFADWRYAASCPKAREAWRHNFSEMRRFCTGLFTSPAAVDEIHLVAAIRLLNDPTITTYTFDGGVEQRSLASPWRRIDSTLQNIADAVAEASERKATAFSKAQ